MLFGFAGGELELRAKRSGGAQLSGRFPYGPEHKAVLSDGGRNGGRPRKEFFKRGAFRHSVESKDQQIFLLSGHDYSRPLASKFGGSLQLNDTATALEFVADISEEVLSTSHGKDVMVLLSAGLATGLSPGFRLPPPRTVKEAETIFDEPETEGTAIVRQINEAILFELSIVTAAAYPDAQVEKRSWQLTDQRAINRKIPAAMRWR